MAIASMTGFARAEGRHEGYSFAWEARSVNGKGLDLKFRLPLGCDGLESALRGFAGERVKRGNVSISLQLARLPGAGGAALRVNRDVLNQVLGLVRELSQEIEAAPPRVDGLLAIRGVLEPVEEAEETPEQRDARLVPIRAAGERLIEELVAMRRAEGARLAEIIRARLDEIADLTRQAESCAAAQPEALKARLRELVTTLLEASPRLPEERLAQEAALLVGRADVREELDRLAAHTAAAGALLQEGGAIGRRFDFLCQEFNREANTLCSKSADLELTRIGLALKAAIEQLREQVQNVE